MAWIGCAMAGYALAALASEFACRRIELPCRAIGTRVAASAAPPARIFGPFAGFARAQTSDLSETLDDHLETN